MNERFEAQLLNVQTEMLSQPMVTKRLDNARYDQVFIRSVQFNPTMIEDEDYYKALRSLEHTAIMHQGNSRLLTAFVSAKTNPNSVFYSKQALTQNDIRKIDQEKYENTLLL